MAADRLSRLALSSLVIGYALAQGCGGPGEEPALDAAVPDAVIVFPDGGPVIDPCDAPIRVTGSLDEVVEVTLDTTMVDARPRDLGLACGNVTAQRWARQQVIEFTVPGTGPLALYMSTVNSGTSDHFHTLLQARTSCSSPPTDTERPTCFDSAGEDELRAAGGLMVRGGETLFIYVTGYSEPPAIEMSEEEGPVRVTFELSENTAPTITSGRFILTSTNRIIFQAMGTDAERAPASMVFGLYGSSGGYDFDGSGSLSYFRLDFDEVSGELPNFVGTASIPSGTLPSQVCSDRRYGCTQAEIAVFDHASLFSRSIRVPMERGVLVAEGATCDDSHFCSLEFVCDAASHVCGSEVGAGAACDATHFCGADHVCDAASATCVATAGVGEACDATHPCAAALSCDAASEVCVASAAIGASCDATHVCEAALSCDAASEKCVATVGEGEACDATHVCESGLACESGVCAAI